MQVVGTYIDGRELTYDEPTGTFTVAGTPVTLNQVLEYDAAGQIAWPSAEMRAWAHQLASASTYKRAWVAPHAQIGSLAVVLPSPTVAPAGWHPDPTGTHQLRYWDGRLWTEHVADDGVVAVDPLAST